MQAKKETLTKDKDNNIIAIHHELQEATAEQEIEYFKQKYPHIAARIGL